MPWAVHPYRKQHAPSFFQLMKPSKNALASAPELESRGNRPLQMTFERQFRALIYFHLEEHTSGRHLIQALKEDDFAREHIAPPDGIEKSSFFEAVNSRGLEQLKHVYEQLQPEASKLLPSEYEELGDLVAIDGSLIQATLSMTWADYRDGSNKAKVHVGFDVKEGRGKRHAVRLCGVAATGLEPRDAPRQLTLAEPTRDRGERLGDTIDRIHARFGSGVVRRAVHVGAGDGDAAGGSEAGRDVEDEG